jgi:hypothetical protein
MSANEIIPKELTNVFSFHCLQNDESNKLKKLYLEARDTLNDFLPVNCLTYQY